MTFSAFEGICHTCGRGQEMESPKDKCSCGNDKFFYMVKCAICATKPAPPPEADRQRALALVYCRSLGEMLRSNDMAHWADNELVFISNALTAPQPHVGVEVTVEELAKALTEEMRDPRHADVQTDKYYANKFETPLRILLDKFHITKITAQKKGG